MDVKPSEDSSNQNEKTIFLREAQQFDGGENEQKSYPLPSWVKPELIKEGQDFVRRNFFSVFFAHFISLIFLLCYAPVRTVLIKTSRSDTKGKALKRYLSTLIHVKRWYEGSLLKMREDAAQDVFRIRKIHEGVSRRLRLIKSSSMLKHTKEIAVEDAKIIKAIQDDMNNSETHIIPQNNNNNEEEYLLDEENRSNCVITQLDMTVTQFCFMGFLLLYPRKFGIQTMRNGSANTAEQKGLEGFVHLWAIIGHLLGIEDRYNLCLARNDDIRAVVLHKILLVDLRKCHEDSVQLWTSLATGISTIIPCISLRAVLLFMLRNLLEFNSTESIFSLLSRYEAFCHRMMSWCFHSWLQFNFVRIILNSLLRLAIYLSGRQHFPNRRIMPIAFHA